MCCLFKEVPDLCARDASPRNGPQDKVRDRVRVVVEGDMQVRVRFFAVHREATGQTSYEADVPAGARAHEVMRLLVQRFPSLGSHASGSAYAVNQTVVPGDTVLHDGDELALLPPMAGG